MQGKIVKGIAGFYYVHDGQGHLYECRAKGIFRNRREKPLVGDNVEFDILDAAKRSGNIRSLCGRSNELLRPAVANVDQALILFAARDPAPNYGLLDRLLVMMEERGVSCIVCFGKADLVSGPQLKECLAYCAQAGFLLLAISSRTGQGIEELKQRLAGRTTVLAGPSGVGKSTLLNRLIPQAEVKTGEVSEKIKRGRHTTRHAEIFPMGEHTYLVDTPGFSSAEPTGVEAKELRQYYHEFTPYEGSCRFAGCVHINEPDCAVKQALQEGRIHRERYENYKALYEELKQKRRY